MWKVLTRGIRESLERRTCRTSLYSQSVQDHSTDNTYHGKPDSNDFNNFSSSSSTNSKKNGSRNKCIISKIPALYRCCARARYSGTKDKEKKDRWDTRYNWVDAVGWSSIIAVGWMVCQSICLQRKLFEKKRISIDKWRNKLLVTPQATKLLKNLILPQTNFLLASCNQILDKSYEKFLSDEIDNEEYQSYGPLTAEETLKQAVREFYSTHESVIGDLELDFGATAIREERYKDALEHFSVGANLSNAPSMFNLALCYELGLGTDKDYVKAAKYYKKAAKQGHVDAMYNLGVFNAQGKGLSVDLGAAREWFSRAAAQGHNQAEKALEMEKSLKQSNYQNKTDYSLAMKTLNSDTKNKSVKLTIYDKSTDDLSNEHNVNTTANSFKDDSMSATEKFLGLLGVHSTFPITVRDKGI